ncbi:hypothetical protein [Ochrobactrum quorumnocens]|uniref:hypothetical protein n=1 Tax=Ochrobactrum quorumnocens TaxID=271865 RepID=UPI0012FDE745|nr:hypothetical protein [[Ochrobactrum] quorumnocens]
MTEIRQATFDATGRKPALGRHETSSTKTVRFTASTSKIRRTKGSGVHAMVSEVME